MDFFEHQEKARRKTRYLIFLFVLALLAIVLAVDVVMAAVFANLGSGSPALVVPSLSWATQNVGIIAWSSLSTVAFVGATSLYRLARLRAGGGSVARGLGGQAVSPDTRDPLRRRLYHIVEEMAIASGVPVPEVYVLESEPGINAFAAGFSTADAAVAVTRGTLETLTRDELQGVVAHEFGHVLNGDMRLNIKLMGLLFGILVIGMIGRTILRSARYSGRRSSRNSGGVGGILAIGASLMVIGYVGVFFARLIKAGVSRQREYLADASAVQFTRQTEGIAGALKKIGGYAKGSSVENPQAEEVSHMLFALGSRSLSSMMATHPPLEARIKALDPQFKPSDLDRIASELQARPPMAASALSEVSALAGTRAQNEDSSTIQVSPEGVRALAGNPGTDHVRYAADLTRSIPPLIYEAAHSFQGAVTLIIALLLDARTDIRERQFALIQSKMGQAFLQSVTSLYPDIERLGARFRLPLIELAFPALKQRPPGQLEFIDGLLQSLIETDQHIDVFEYVLAKVLRSYLEDARQPFRDPRAKQAPTRTSSLHAIQRLFSVLASMGHDSEQGARAAYQAGIEFLLRPKHQLDLKFARPSHWLADIDNALDTLKFLPLRSKEKLLQALVVTVSHDDQVTTVEAELLRGICATLRIPLPPLLAAPS